METIETDVVIIGAGTAGLNARREVERAGKRWLLVDSGPYGTTCARVGCMPSKLLIAAADAAHHVAKAEMFGVRVAAVTVDGRAVMERVRAERDRFAGFVVAATEKLPEERRIHGRARLVKSAVVEVDGAFRLEASAVVVATGSSPIRVPALEPLGDLVSTSDEIFEWKDLPKRVLVVGAGVIGLELGQALHRLGVKTIIIDRSKGVAGILDPEVAKKARAVLGLDLRSEMTVSSAVRTAEGAKVTLADWGGALSTVEVDRVLVTVGRTPNLRGLDLADWVPLDERGVPRHDRHTLQCGNTPVFIAGDAAADRPVLHEAADDGSIAGRNAAHFPTKGRHHARRTPLSIAFVSPNIAAVGAPFDQLDQACTAIGEVSYDDQGRSRVMGENAGLLRIYADRRSHRLLGAEMVAPRGEHLAHLLAWAIGAELTIERALDMPFYHPVVEEGVRTALQALARELRADDDCTAQVRPPAP